MYKNTLRPKLVFVGSPFVGKTALICRIESNHFIDHYHVFIDDVTETCVSFDDGDHPVTLFDTFDDWGVWGSDGLFVVYPFSNRKSFDALESIIGDALNLRG